MVQEIVVYALIAAAVAYAAHRAVRRWRRRNERQCDCGCGGSCAGCPCDQHAEAPMKPEPDEPHDSGMAEHPMSHNSMA